MGFRTFADRKAAEAAVVESGLGRPPDRVTYSRQKDGRIKPIVHVEHYADAEYVRDACGFDCRCDA